MKRGKNKAIIAIIVILALIFAGAAGFIIFKLVNGASANDRYDKIASSYASNLSETEGSQQSPGSQSTEASSKLAENPVNVAELHAQNPDIYSWIYIPETNVNYPVAQSGDNAFYLEHFLDGSRISGGTLFADCSCPSDFSGKNTIIYGHNMKDGSMFALIDDYADQNFYEEHPFLYLNTPTQNYRLDIFSGFTTDPLSFVYTTAFASTEDFAAFLRSLYAFSEIDCRTAVSPDDRIVILSTCTYSGEDVRFVVCGKLTAIG